MFPYSSDNSDRTLPSHVPAYQTPSSYHDASLDDDGTRLLTGFTEDEEDLEDISTDVSTSDSDEEEYEYRVDTGTESTHLASRHSLGKMVPHPQSTVVPVYNTRLCNTVVIESRDRNLKHEHLFQFTVRFQPPTTQSSQTERLAEKTLIKAFAQRQDLRNDTSYATYLTSTKQAKFIAKQKAISQCLPPPCDPPRSCKITEAFTDIVSLTCNHAIFPKYTYMQCISTDGSTIDIPDAHVSVPLDVQVSPLSNMLAGTGDIIRCSSFTCVPSYNYSHHTHYRPLNCKVNYDTPLASLDQLTITIHTPVTPLQKHPFEYSTSPDIHQVTTIESTSKTLIITLHQIPHICDRPLVKGDIVSLRDIGWKNIESLTPEQKHLRTFMCSCVTSLQFVVLAVDDKTVTLDLTKSGISDTMEVPIATLDSSVLDAQHTLLLNESMQFRLVFEVERIVRRLKQQVAVSSI